MPLWNVPQELLIDENAVLRGQGADPDVIRQRSPRLAEISKRAVNDGRSYLDPRVIFQKLEIENVLHEQIILENGKKISGSLIANHLGQAEYVVLLLCTIGTQLEDYVSVVMEDDMVYGLALDGVGSAAVEALANAACRFFEDQALQIGRQSTIPLSPGMVDWDVEDGQPELFEILDASQINVKLSSKYVMSPRKSLSMIMGFGLELNQEGKICDYCAMRDTCRYQDHY